MILIELDWLTDCIQIDCFLWLIWLVIVCAEIPRLHLVSIKGDRVTAPGTIDDLAPFSKRRICKSIDYNNITSKKKTNKQSSWAPNLDCTKLYILYYEKELIVKPCIWFLQLNYNLLWFSWTAY